MVTFPLCHIVLIILTLLTPSINSQSCTVTEIIFSDNGEQLYVRFNVKVDTTNLLDTSSSCTNYFDEASMILLSDSTCSFSSMLESNTVTSTLLIQLSSTATIQANTESLTLVPNAFSCSNISSTPIVIQSPVNKPNTQIIIDSTVPTTIGSCDAFLISAYSSTGVTYRVYNWQWTIRNGILEHTYYTGQIPQLLLQPNDMPYAGKITITVHVNTYLLTSSIAQFEVEKSDLPSPEINVFGPSQWIYSEPLTYIVQISHTACDFDDTLYIFDIKCEADDDNVNKAMIQHSNQFYIPSGLMLVGNTYTFTCEASSDDGELIGTSTDSLTVNIVSGSIIASIAGGNGIQLNRNPMVLDGQSLSYSWSNIEGSIENADIKWNCTALGMSNNRRRRLLQLSTTSYFSTVPTSCDCPSVVTDETLLNIPANTLGDGCSYKFDIDIDNGGNIGTDSVIIEATSQGSSVSIWRDSYCINEINDIKLIAVVTTDTASTDTVIDQYFWQETTKYLEVSKWERQESTLIIPKNTLLPYVTYKFSLVVTITDPLQSTNSITNTANIEIKVNDAPTITSFEVNSENNNDNTIEQTYTLKVGAFSDYAPNSFQFFWRYNNASFDETDNVPLTQKMSSNEVKNIYLPEGDLVLTAKVFDLCQGVASFVKYITVNHNLDNITCDNFYNDIIDPLFETAASVKDYNRVLNVFNIATTTIKKLKLQQNDGNDNNMNDVNTTTNITANITTTTTTTTTAAPSTCFSDIVDAFASALKAVTIDLDACIEHTTILQKQLLTAIDLVGDDLSPTSNEVFTGIVDQIWSGCDQTEKTDAPLCSDIEANSTKYNNTKCINETDIFSGILTPEQIFRGDQVTEEQVSITTALMDSVLSSTSLSCTDIRATIYNIFGLLESIVATDFPGDDGTVIKSSDSFYEAFVQRVTPQTAVTITFNDEDEITIPADVTLSGRSLFGNYGSGELDSVDIFAIKVKHSLLAQCSDILMPDALKTDRNFVDMASDATKTKTCGEILTDVYLVEIDMDGDTTNLTDNIGYKFDKKNMENKCTNNIENITDNTQDLTTTVDTKSFTLCGHYPSVIPSDINDLEWSFNGCSFVEETSNTFSCICNHLSFHSVSKIYLIEEIEIASLLENKYIFYVVIIGFCIIGFIALIQILMILSKGFCKLEASVIIYYVMLFSCVFQGICVWLLSTQENANGNNSENNDLLSLDVITSSLRFVILSIVLNTWFRIKGGKKESNSRLQRWPLNILAVIMIIYDIICVIIQVTNIDNGEYDDIFVIGNLIVNIASGSLAVIWLIWRPILCIRRCKKKEKIIKKAKGYIRLLWILLIIICIGQIIQSLFVLFATTEYFEVNSSNTPYVSQWRLINYSIDIISWFIIILFYICIYVKSTRSLRVNPSQIGAIFKGSKFDKEKRKSQPSFVEESESRSRGFMHIKGIHDDATSPKKKKKNKRKKSKKRKDRAHSESDHVHPMPPSEQKRPPFNPWSHHAQPI